MDYCLPCLGRPAPPQRIRQSQQPQQDQNGVNKLVAILTALNAGKLPSQDQLSAFLRFILNSELLREDTGTDMLPGNGPMSVQGRKALSELRNVIQATLQFGMEKNDDDKIQDLLYETTQIEGPPIGLDLDDSAASTRLDTLSAGASELKDQLPTAGDFAFDAATLINAFHTIVQSFFTSAAFRLILADFFSILRDLLAHAAGDVADTAIEVHGMAGDVEDRLKAQSMTTNVGLDDLSATVNSLVDEAKDRSEDSVNKMRGIKDEWKNLGAETADKIKNDIVLRLQQTLDKVQRDPALRYAVKAILIVLCKYAYKFVIVADIISESTSPPNYPPHPYPTGSNPNVSVISPALKQALADFQTLLERIAQGRSLTGLLSAFENVVSEITSVPGEVAEEVEKRILDKDVGKKGKKGNKAKQKAKQKQADKEAGVDPTGDTVLWHYFSNIGRFLEKALAEPGWAMSHSGQVAVKTLVENGVRLVSVVGEVVEEEIVGVIDEKEEAGNEAQGQPKAPSELQLNKFGSDVRLFLHELEAYVLAVEGDKTTMKLVNALDSFGDSVSHFTSTGVIQQRKRDWGQVWTQWLGWAIPRVIKMLPAGTIPIPSIEVKSGGVQAGLYALFVQGLKNGGGVGTSLVPDEVVVKEWSEMKIDMADPPSTSTSNLNEGYSTNLTQPAVGTRKRPSIETTSRVRVHIDGVRAKAEGMGYYFKYPILGDCIYEDEGVLSVDVGMGATGAGFGIDVEVEIESRSVPLEHEENVVIPAIVVHSEDEQQVIDGDDDDDGPPNIDIQKAVAQAVRRSAAVASPTAAAAGEVNVSRHDVSKPASVIAKPLFRVVDVEVALRGLNFKIDQSRHWILNKVVLQPLVGPTVSRLAKKALEDKVRTGLEELSQALGDAIVDVQQNAVAREGAEDTLEWAAVIGDWVRALVKALIKHTHRDDAESVDGSKTTTHVDATLKGVVYTSTTAQQQPTATPPMVYDRSNEELTATAPRDGKGRQELEQDFEADDYETVVAVGGGPQLFPGKGGPYGARNDDAASGGNDEERQGLIEGLKRLADDAVDEARRGREVVREAGANWDERKKVEAQGNGWRSEAFNIFDVQPSSR